MRTRSPSRPQTTGAGLGRPQTQGGPAAIRREGHGPGRGGAVGWRAPTSRDEKGYPEGEGSWTGEGGQKGTEGGGGGIHLAGKW